MTTPLSTYGMAQKPMLSGKAGRAKTDLESASPRRSASSNPALGTSLVGGIENWYTSVRFVYDRCH